VEVKIKPLTPMERPTYGKCSKKKMLLNSSFGEELDPLPITKEKIMNKYLKRE
jgi:hypothetical protein